MNAQWFPLVLADGVQPVVLPGELLGQQGFMLAASTPPGAGVVHVEYRRPNSSEWLTPSGGAAAPLTAPVALSFFDLVAEYRLTLSGVVGGANLSLWVATTQGEGFPAGAFTGSRALTVQPYTEANVKNGLEYYLRAVWPIGDEIPAGQTRKMYFLTGDKIVIVKSRELLYVAEQLTLRLFRSPTGVSGGTPLNIHNFNNVNPVPTTLQTVLKNVTTVADGVEFDGGNADHFFGETGVGQRSQHAIPEGRERIIPPNTGFIVAIANTGSGSARVQYRLEWYEGTPDLPLPP